MRTAQVIGTLQAVALTITGALPTFLTSALAVQVRDDLHLGPAALGFATSTLFAVSGLSARMMGNAVQARGSRFGYTLAAGLSAVSLSIVALAPTYPVLVLGMAVGGLGNSAAQPTANLLLTQVVGPRRLGLAMGIKQCYIPIASLLGGLAVPTIALVFGWRWALVGGAALSLAIAVWGALTVRQRFAVTPSTGVDKPAEFPRRGLVMLTVGGGMAAASATALGIFTVSSGVAAGVSPAAAGYLLAVCSALTVVSRVSLGWLADRIRGKSLYVVVANLMLTSVVGYLLLAFGGRQFFVVGALIAYFGWTWAGLFHLAVVRDSAGSVASSTGIVQTGLALGAAVGPLTLGLLAEGVSYRAAWIFAAAVGLVGVLVTRHGRRIVRLSRGLPVRSYALRSEHA